MTDAWEIARDKMRDAGVGENAINVFYHYYEQLREGHTGIVSEEDIEPLGAIPHLDDVDIDEDDAIAALDKTVYIKLNGGLGTSMGLNGPKTLLPVRPGMSFLDVIARQVLSARTKYGVRLPVLFMNSFATQEDSLAELERYPELGTAGLPLDFLQSQEPKLRTYDLKPVAWAKNRQMEWCPPGHGDIYPSLVDSGVLQQLIDAGFTYANISNGDNLGAMPNPKIAGWFEATGADFASEVCRRTPNDRKGGHLAVRKSDGRIILRETAQTSDEDMEYFADESRHKFFNANNLWINLPKLAEVMSERDGVLGLPMIRNVKTVDPSNPKSTEVVQIETAMGSAIEVFENSAVLEVPRDRLIAVKKTNELLLLRSDCYRIDEATGYIESQVESAPRVDLDPDYYALIDDFAIRCPHPLNMTQARSLTVRGNFTFGQNVTVIGDAELHTDQAAQIDDWATIGHE